MAIIKCKMCGGDIELAADKTFGTCECCGSTMTFPKVDDDQRAAAFNRGNHFRRIGEFDKALAVYERIVREDDTDAEAHWCCALCRFGIEYVEDPATYEWLPTCHRASFDSFLEDVDFQAALTHSDGITRRQYQKDAAKIAEVQRGILATSQNTEPYDVFICYKESDAQGNRTRDSLLAQDIYYQLTEQGRKVFFARITLEDVAGTQYEPYIFAALNSAKVMVVVGTKPEHLSAVWVKNEWSRFLAMMKKDHSKLLLPCYRDMDPYDLPEQLSVLQSYDMAKIGFIQDLTRGIGKVLSAEEKLQTRETVVVQQTGGTNVSALLKRGNMALEDGEWEKADSFFEEVLNQDPENADAYLGKFLAEKKQNTLESVLELQYQSMLRNVRKATKKVALDEQHKEQWIRVAAEKYVFPGGLEWHMVEGFCPSEVSYTSEHSYWQDQLAAVKTYPQNQKTLFRAIKFANNEKKEGYNLAFQTLEQKIEERIRQAMTEDGQKEQEILNDLGNSVDQAAGNLADLYRKNQESAEERYEQMCEMQSKTNDIWRLRSLSNDFWSLRYYKDCQQRYDQCQKRIQEMELEMENRRKRNDWIAMGRCSFCGGELKGFFTQRCKVCAREKDY